jgi:hypothetical protein
MPSRTPRIVPLSLLVHLAAGQAFAKPPESGEEQPIAEEEPFVEEEPCFDAGLLLDFRFAYTDDTMSFLDGGLGKTRYGGDEDSDERALARLAQLSFTADVRLFQGLGAHVQVNFDAEPDRGDAAERMDLIEAFLRYRFGLGEQNEARGKLGLFFAPISLEHPGEAWTTFYSITPSVINGWVGEEIRALVAELSFARTGVENELSVTAAAFGWNDPSASLLAYRGWAIHDRQTGLADEIPLAPIPSISEGGLFSVQAPSAEPIVEIDDRVGWYAAAAWDNYRRFLVNAIYYDNRAQPMAFDSGQYGWHTRFYDVGLLYTFSEGTSGPELLAQFLSGDTWMGNQVPDLPKVTFDYRSFYSLFTVPFGRHRLSFRYDWFETVDRDELVEADNNNEVGNAFTFAYLLRTTEKRRLAVEILRVESDRGGRASIGLPTEATEWLFQLSYRLAF